MKKLTFTLHLTWLASQLRMSNTDCRYVESGQINWISQMAEASVNSYGAEAFTMTNPARALLLLLLRDLGQPPKDRIGLEGGEGSLARSLYELVTDKKAKDGGKTWLQKMFTDPKNTTERPLSPRLFERKKHSGRFIVHLGQDWNQAEVKVFLDGKKVEKSEYRKLAKQAEAWDLPVKVEPKVELSATLDLLVWRDELQRCISVRESAGRPLRMGDRTRLHITSSSEMHHYLFWLTLERGQCLHAPFHPWRGSWKDFDNAKDLICRELALPQGRDETFSELRGNGASLETIILLARCQPLGLDLRRRMEGEFQSVVNSIKAKPALDDLTFIHAFVHPGNEFSRSAGERLRTFPDFTRTLPIDTPIYQLTTALVEKFGSHFDLIRTLTVANIGER